MQDVMTMKYIIYIISYIVILMSLQTIYSIIKYDLIEYDSFLWVAARARTVSG